MGDLGVIIGRVWVFFENWILQFLREDLSDY